MRKGILRLNEVLQEKKITQKSLAERLKISKQSVNYWVNNRNYPSIETLKVIANELKIDIKDLFI
jgi:transcriptional regulator with XRE-family HTH domain